MTQTLSMPCIPKEMEEHKVLLVDDELLIAMDCAETVREMGFKDVLFALSYEEADEFVSAFDFCFALLDVNLGDGRTTLPIAERLIAKGTKVIFASGYNSSEGLVKHLNAPLIEKPFASKTLILSIMTHWISDFAYRS